MSSTQLSRLDPAALDRVLGALVGIGVAGNERDRRFEAQDIQTSLQALESRLQATSYHGGSLSIGTLVRPHDEVDVLVYDSDRYQGVNQAELAWERDYQERWHEIVERRVQDWLRRLSALRLQIETWVRNEPEFETLRLIDLPTTHMLEDLMRRFAVQPVEMPVFELRAGAKRVFRFQPKGLWIIGANGRVDITTRFATRILVDESDPLAASSLWQMYDLRESGTSVPLTEATLKDLIRPSI